MSTAEQVLRRPVAVEHDYSVSLEHVREKAKRKKWRTSIRAWILLLPSLIFLGIFTVYPIIQSAISSLYKDDLTTITPVFSGLDNYRALVSDPIFWECIRNNLLIAVVTVPASIALGVAMASFSHSLGKKGKTLTRIGFIYPTFIPLVAAANIWMFIYTPIYGLLGYLNPEWRLLANGKTAIWAIIVMLIWKQAGYLMLFYIAGLNGISREVFEAAELDGARGFQKFRTITWPLLKPTTMYVFIIALTSAFKTVDHLYIMTKGGPGNATNMLLFYIYQTGFDYWNNGKASAMTVILVGLLLIITAVKFFYDDRKAYYND
ncbi:MAG: sugar ABC transporter permease [Lachnospiraceae bacterium]|nr:sugar ABC transporter permease [Lachnospiraceae bacterium]